MITVGDNDGHLWVLMRYDTNKGVAIPWVYETAKVKTQNGDALDQFLNHVFTGIQNDALEVVMSEDD